ncbi:MAG: VWA domain-containing protein [Spirochaetales bacterium]|nr:VWA domain-containing protein [Spirochaetales bacterium]
MAAVAVFCQADPLVIESDEFIITQTLEGGYFLWVKAVPGLGSILLTESTEDPEKKAASYALRNPEYHPANGDEKRLIDGKFLTTPGFFSLIDSTAEAHPVFGQAYRIFIPYIVLYGNPWSRSGEIQVLDGAYLSIRTFEKPYGDYEGPFRDNPFILRVSQAEAPEAAPDTDTYMDDTEEAYTRIAEEGDGTIVYSTGLEDITGKIEQIIDKAKGASLDLVLALDTTQSMHDDIPHLRKDLVPMLERITAEYTGLRVGVVLYRDYFEEYVTKDFPFQPGLGTVQRILDRIRVFGGKDIPEAVYEAMYAGLHRYPWQADHRMIILVGDAPPHPRPRGKITGEMVLSDAKALNVELHTIILPH